MGAGRRRLRGEPDGDFRIKSRQDSKAVHLKDVDTFDCKKRDEGVEVKVVAMWSRRYAERARHEREKVLEKSRQLVASPGSYTRATHYGAAQFVKGVTFDRRTDLTDEVFALVGEEAPRKWMRARDIKALFAKGKRIRWR